MACPDREQLSRYLDGLEPDLTPHVGGCRTCGDELSRLGEVDALLRDAPRPESAGCPTPTALLAALGGGPLPGGCDPCADEVAELREVLLLHERNELERPSAGLRARLKRLAPAGQATADELTPFGAATAPARPSTRSARRSAVVKLHSGTGRLASGTGRTATSVRRRPAPPGARTIDRRGQPGAWAIMASAAALLFGMAVLLGTPSGPGPGAEGAVAQATPRAPTPTRPAEATPQRGAPFRVVGAPTPAPTERQAPAQEDARPLPPDASPDEDEVEVGPSEPLATGEPEREPQPAPAPAPEGEGPALASTAPSRPLSPDPDVGGHPLPPGSSEQVGPAPRAPASDDGGRLAIALERLVGAPQVQTEEGAWVALARAGKAELRPGDKLRTGGRGAFLSLEGGAYELCLDAETELEVRAAAAGPRLALDRGKLLAEVVTLVPGRRFQVETPQGEVEVLGTTFGLEARPEGTRLTVLEGTVAARSAAGQEEVSAGYAAAFSRARAPAAEPADPRALAWARDLLPRREALVAVDFDDRVLGGFEGELTAEGALGGKGLALLLGQIGDNRYWGQRARAAEGRIGAFRAGRDVWVQASVWSEEATEVTLVVTNETQKRDFKLGFSLSARRWKTVHVPLMDLTTYFDPAKNPMREGDLLVSMDVYATKPGATHRVLLDGVSVYRKVYRR